MPKTTPPPTLFDVALDISHDQPQFEIDAQLRFEAPSDTAPARAGPDRAGFDRGTKTPAPHRLSRPGASVLDAAMAARRPSSGTSLSPELIQARRRRARARLARRRYQADTVGYEHLEQARRALHLVSD